VSGINRFDLFARTRESLGQHLSEALSEGLLALADALGQSATRTASPETVEALVNAERMLRTDLRARVRGAVSTLNDLTFRLLELNQSSGRGDDSAWLSLLPERELEMQILADELANAIQEQVGCAYAAWLKRIEQLTLHPASETRVPFGAATVAAAALAALEPVAADRSLRPAVRMAVLEELAPRLARALSQTDAWLAAQGVLPDEPTARVGAGQSTDVAPSDIESVQVNGIVAPAANEGDFPSRAAEQISAALTVSNHLGFQPLATNLAGQPNVQRAACLPRPFQLVHDAIAFADSHGVEPYSREARRRYFLAPRSEMIRMGATPEQVAVLDLVAGLFDQVSDSPDMPPSARALMWRLQEPVAILATLDSSYLADERRSLRALIEAIASISGTHHREIEQQGEIFQRLETSVRALEVMAHSLQLRAVALGTQIRREYGRAAEGVSTLLSKLTRERQVAVDSHDHGNRRNASSRPSREVEEAVTRRLERDLRERLSRSEVPESIQEFLLAVWLRHLRTAVLRDGENSVKFKQAMQVVDDLLWTLDSSGPGLSRRQLANRIPPLIRTLRQGVNAVGARQEEYQPFLDTLFLMHLRKMQKVPASGPDTQPVPDATHSSERDQDDPPTVFLDESVQVGLHADRELPSDLPAAPTLRAEALETPGSTLQSDAKGLADPVLVADDERLPAVLASVDLNDFPSAPRRLQMRPEEIATTLRVGDWLEMDGRSGETQQVKVAWLNSGRTVVLLLRRADRRVVSLQMRELQRRFTNRLAWLVV